jgi:hypothetical protein
MKQNESASSEKEDDIQSPSEEDCTSTDVEIVQLMLAHGNSPKEIAARINKDILAVYKVLDQIAKSQREIAWERDHEKIVGQLEDIDWYYSQYEELSRMYKVVVSNIERYSESAFSSSNLATLYVNIYDRMIDAYEQFREERKRLNEVMNEKYSPTANKKLQQMAQDIRDRDKFSLEDLGYPGY